MTPWLLLGGYLLTAVGYGAWMFGRSGPVTPVGLLARAVIFLVAFGSVTVAGRAVVSSILAATEGLLSAADTVTAAVLTVVAVLLTATGTYCARLLREHSH